VPKPSTLVLRRLTAPRRVIVNGDVHYADSTEAGSIIDTQISSARQHCPWVLERFHAIHRREPGCLLPNSAPVWEVIECYRDLEKAGAGAKRAKDDPRNKNAVLRLRDRRNNDIIMAALF
jgi:hypothetical protein